MQVQWNRRLPTPALANAGSSAGRSPVSAPPAPGGALGGDPTAVIATVVSPGARQRDGLLAVAFFQHGLPPVHRAQDPSLWDSPVRSRITSWEPFSMNKRDACAVAGDGAEQRQASGSGGGCASTRWRRRRNVGLLDHGRRRRTPRRREDRPVARVAQFLDRDCPQRIPARRCAIELAGLGARGRPEIGAHRNARRAGLLHDRRRDGWRRREGERPGQSPQGGTRDHFAACHCPETEMRTCILAASAALVPPAAAAVGACTTS